MIEGPLKADGRLAAKNAVKIRAALTQVTNFRSVFNRYQETHPQATDNKAQDRARARAWIMLNVGFNNDALYNSIMLTWAEAYVLGQDAADYWIKETYEAKKAVQGVVNWDTWKPGDRATALLIKPVGGFARYLEWTNATSYFRGFNKETVEMLGTALADSIEAGFEAEAAALYMKDYVGSASRALTIAITEQSRALAFSSIQRYKEGGIEKIEWNVADPCPTCAMNAGVVVQIGQTFPSGDAQPPAHPHCKCRPIPVIPGMEPVDVIAENTPVMPTDGNIKDYTPAPVGAWTPIDEDRWIERQEALLIKQGFDPATEWQRGIMRDQVKDARVIYEKGPHAIVIDKKLEGVKDEHVEAFMKHFDLAYEKLPEWRKFNPDGTPRGYTLIVDKRTPGAGTLAYTYLGHDTIWFSGKNVIDSLTDKKQSIGWFMPVAETVNENLYVIAHELGHTVDSNVNETARGKVRSNLTRKYKGLFSRYSRKNTKETYAEVFAQWMLGEKTPLTEAYSEAFGWDLSAKDYYAKFPESARWKQSYRGSGTL